MYGMISCVLDSYKRTHKHVRREGDGKLRGEANEEKKKPLRTNPPKQGCIFFIYICDDYFLFARSSSEGFVIEVRKKEAEAWDQIHQMMDFAD